MGDTLQMNMGVAFVADPAMLAAVAFRPEDIHLGDYAFVPWVRSGLSAGITAAPVAGALRATVRAEFDVADSANPATKAAVSRDLTLFGPGDVVGIDPAQIIRREPALGTPDAECDFLAHVEFARPDFPWLFSPAPAAGNVCPPWLALVVVEARVSQLRPAEGARPAQLFTQMDQLQPLETNTHFAHAQVVGAALEAGGPRLRGEGADTVETRLSDEHGPANLSRILCPRRLDDGVDYIAALVPAFDAGVKRGLGQVGGTLDPAWTRAPGDGDTAIVLPVYDAWPFRTAPGGSFGELASRIKGRAAPWSIGRRFIDLSRPGGTLPDLLPGHRAGVQVLECALFSPAARPAGLPAPTPWPTAHREALRVRVDQANAGTEALPRVGARLYARYQRAAARLGKVFGDAPFDATAVDADWFSQLNTDPMLRIVAGLGAKVVQKDQEPLMQAAWAQVEGIRRANQALVWAGMAEKVNTSLQTRHLQPLDDGRLMQVTRNLHARLRDAGQSRTIAAAFVQSRTAEASFSAAFRRMTRQGGPLARRAGLADPAALTTADGRGFRDHRRPVAVPDGIVGLSAAALSFLDPDLVGRVMDVAPDRALGALNDRMRMLATSGTATMRLSRGNWAGPGRGVPGGSAGGIIGGVLLDEMRRVLDAGDLVRGRGAAALAEVALGVKNAGVEARSGALLDTLAGQAPRADLPRVILRGGVAAPPVWPGPVMAPPVIRPMPMGRGGGVVIGRGGFGPRPRPRSSPGPVIVEPPRTPPADPPATPEVRFETPLARDLTAALREIEALGLDGLRTGLAQIVTAAARPPAINTDLGPARVTRAGVIAQIDPNLTARAAMKGRLSLRTDLRAIPPAWLDLMGLTPIMAAPIFNRPMYQALTDYDRDWLVPGLGQIAGPDFVTLLSINPGFAESFLIGASDEMGRELLWRNYPTDQRGTYFKRFWDAAEDELTGPIHRFARTPVGSHLSVGGDKPAGAGALALVIKGELLRRFPGTVVMAMRAMNDTAPPKFIDDSEAAVLFHARLDPDYTLVGFDLTREQVLGPQNWWFVLAQNPTAPRFGAFSTVRPGTGHNDLDWADFGNVPQGGFLPVSGGFNVTDPNARPASVRWPGHAGTVARILMRNPVRAAFRARDLIQSAGG